jgi:undecaprenyl-diphosphatase
MDGEISARLMKLAGKHPLLDRFWVFCARYLIVLFGLLFLWSWWSVWRQSTDAVTRTVLLYAPLAAIIVNETVSWGIGYLRFRPRPFVENHLTPLVRIAPGMKSFPSDHAVISFSLATLIALMWVGVSPWFGIAAYATALVISVARVVSGVHYPSDVIAGATLGILGTLACTYLVVMNISAL